MSLESKYQTTALGFLPEACLKSLPTPLANSYLQVLLDNLHIPDGHQFRSLVDVMQYEASIEEYLASAPQPESDHLYAIFTLISQKYIWGCGPDHLLSTLPRQIGLPLLAASKKTGLPPVLTYASCVLWNWSLKDETKPFALENLQLNHKISEGVSFEWFFLIHIAIEGLCGYAVNRMMATKNLMKKGDNEGIEDVIKDVMKVTKLAEDILLRMREHCLPEDFWGFRMYLSGTQDPVFFPKGLQVEGVEGTDLSFRGASGTQSSLIQALDAFYSIKHGSHEESFIQENKHYMPPAHKKYLEDLASGLILRDYVERSSDMHLKSVFQEGVAVLEKFRKSHVGIVHSYIVKFMKPRSEAPSADKKEVNVFGENGSGGTNFRILLNNITIATGQGKQLNSIEGNSSGKGEKGYPVVKKVFSVEKGTIMTFFKYLLMIIVSMLALRLFRTYLTNDINLMA